MFNALTNSIWATYAICWITQWTIRVSAYALVSMSAMCTWMIPQLQNHLQIAGISTGLLPHGTRLTHQRVSFTKSSIVSAWTRLSPSIQRCVRVLMIKCRQTLNTSMKAIHYALNHPIEVGCMWNTKTTTLSVWSPSWMLSYCHHENVLHGEMHMACVSIKLIRQQSHHSRWRVRIVAMACP